MQPHLAHALLLPAHRVLIARVDVERVEVAQHDGVARGAAHGARELSAVGLVGVVKGVLLAAVLVVEDDLAVVARHHDGLPPGQGEGHAGVPRDDVRPALRRLEPKGVDGPVCASTRVGEGSGWGLGKVEGGGKSWAGDMARWTEGDRDAPRCADTTALPCGLAEMAVTYESVWYSVDGLCVFMLPILTLPSARP